VLRVDLGISIDLCKSQRPMHVSDKTHLIQEQKSKGRTGRGGDEEPGLDSLGETEHVQRAHEGRLDRLDGIVLVVRRRGGASKVVDLCFAPRGEDEPRVSVCEEVVRRRSKGKLETNGQPQS
jgi:hypothetical protein